MDLMDGVEFSEVLLSDLEFSRRIDSEYYQKKYLNCERMIQKHNNCKMEELCHFLIGPFGSAYDTSNYTEISEYRYIRGKDVKPFFLQESSPRYISKEDYFRLRKYALQKDDVLISVVGTIGNACIVQSKELPAIFSCKSTVVRVDKIDPYYLISYLNSKYGRQLLLRQERGAIQKGLNLDDLKLLDTPCFSEDLQRHVHMIVDSARIAIENSGLLYKEAQSLLLKELNFNLEIISREGITQKKLSDSFETSGRLDAEYYQPKYDDLFSVLKKLPTEPLGSLVNLKKSIEPGSAYYGNVGLPFIRVSDVSVMGISTPSIRVPYNIIPSINRYFPKKDTILLSKDGSISIAYKVEVDIEVLTSSALLHLCVIKPERILPDYLTLVLNSDIVRLQAERDSSGAIIQHWKPGDIKKVLIPVLSYDIQQKISEMVQESFVLRRKAEKLIKIAVKAVEIAIESDEEAALSYMDFAMQ